MRRACSWTLVLVIAGSGLCELSKRRQIAIGPEHGPVHAAATVVPDGQTVVVPVDSGGKSQPSKRMAFRLALEGEVVKLIGTEELQGDFHRRRGRLAWWPGMLYFRLLDVQQRVLAEETMAAPERTCVVLRTGSPEVDGDAPPTARVSTGAPVVLQVRMPSVAGASQLQVYRLTGEQPADSQAEAPRKLLATLALQQ